MSIFENKLDKILNGLVSEGYDKSIINQWRQQFPRLQFLAEDERLSVSGDPASLLSWLSTIRANDPSTLGYDMAIEQGPIFEKSKNGFMVSWLFY
jgi:hypothetical protein